MKSTHSFSEYPQVMRQASPGDEQFRSAFHNAPNGISTPRDREMKILARIMAFAAGSNMLLSRKFLQVLTSPLMEAFSVRTSARVCWSGEESTVLTPDHVALKSSDLAG
jgi:hypothetical protein